MTTLIKSCRVHHYILMMAIFISGMIERCCAKQTSMTLTLSLDFVQRLLLTKNVVLATDFVNLSHLLYMYYATYHSFYVFLYNVSLQFVKLVQQTNTMMTKMNDDMILI